MNNSLSGHFVGVSSDKNGVDHKRVIEMTERRQPQQKNIPMGRVF